MDLGCVAVGGPKDSSSHPRLAGVFSLTGWLYTPRYFVIYRGSRAEDGMKSVDARGEVVGSAGKLASSETEGGMTVRNNDIYRTRPRAQQPVDITVDEENRRRRREVAKATWTLYIHYKRTNMKRRGQRKVSSWLPSLKNMTLRHRPCLTTLMAGTSLDRNSL